MNTKKHINSKPSKRKSECLSKLSIVKAVDSFSVFAETNSGGFVPLRVGTLQEVIAEAEHCAAYFGLPVEHELNQPVKLTLHVYKRVGTHWLWAGQRCLSYRDADEAYMYMRTLTAEVQGFYLTTEADNVKFSYTCSHNCSRQWRTILHRLQFNGQLPPGKTEGECNRCFSLFVNSLEGGDVCLNCGYEQIKN